MNGLWLSAKRNLLILDQFQARSDLRRCLAPPKLHSALLLYFTFSSFLVLMLPGASCCTAQLQNTYFGRNESRKRRHKTHHRTIAIPCLQTWNPNQHLLLTQMIPLAQLYPCKAIIRPRLWKGQSGANLMRGYCRLRPCSTCCLSWWVSGIFHPLSVFSCALLSRRNIMLFSVSSRRRTYENLPYQDRSNIGNAKVAGLQTDLKMTNHEVRGYLDIYSW